jgi:uncharacterized protein (DUF1697 family)
MKDLVSILEELDCQNVATYIQSGNAIVETEDTITNLAKKIRTTIMKRLGFEPQVLMLETKDLERAIAANPFADGESDPKSLHVGFLFDAPAAPDLEKLEALRAPSERFRLIDRVFYLHAPEGIGRSKLAARAERILGVAMTDRNWRTVTRMLEMARTAARTSGRERS